MSMSSIITRMCLAALCLAQPLSASATQFVAGETPEDAVELGYRWVRGTVAKVERVDTNWAGRPLRPGQTNHRVTLDVEHDYSGVFDRNPITFSYSCDASTPCTHTLDVGASEYFNLFESDDYLSSTHFGGTSGGRMENITGPLPERLAAEFADGLWFDDDKAPPPPAGE